MSLIAAAAAQRLRIVAERSANTRASTRNSGIASCRRTASNGLPALRRSSTGRRTMLSRHLPIRAALQKAEGWEPKWTQTTNEVSINLPIPDDVRGRDIEMTVHPKRITLSINGTDVITGQFDDATDQPLVQPDGCFWNIEEDEASGRFVQIVLEKKEVGYESWEGLFAGEGPNMEFTNIVYMDVQIGDKKDSGKIIIGLYGHIAPKTCVNFLELCKGSTKSRTSGSMLTYKGTPFHRIIPGFMAQGGDITMGNGTGGESIYGERFEDENFVLKHDSAGILSMANAGPDTNGSQFFMLFEPQPHLDGKHTVFGKVLGDESMKVLRKLENLGTPDGTPKTPILISGCGEAELREAPEQTDAEVEDIIAQMQSNQPIAPDF